MRALVLVASRELRAYAPAWVAALVAATLPWLAPLLPVAGGQPAGDVRLATAAAARRAARAHLRALRRRRPPGARPRRRADGVLPRPAAARRDGVGGAAARRRDPRLRHHGGDRWCRPRSPPASCGARARRVRGGDGRCSLAGEAPAPCCLLLPPLFLILLAHLLATARAQPLALAARRPRRPGRRRGRRRRRARPPAAGRRAARAADRRTPWPPPLALVALAARRRHRPRARRRAAHPRAPRAGGLRRRRACWSRRWPPPGSRRWVLAVDAGDLTAVEDGRGGAATGRGSSRAGTLRHRPSYRPWMLVDLADRALAAARRPDRRGDGNDVGCRSPLAFSADGRARGLAAPARGALRRAHEAVWVELGDQSARRRRRHRDRPGLVHGAACRRRPRRRRRAAAAHRCGPRRAAAARRRRAAAPHVSLVARAARPARRRVRLARLAEPADEAAAAAGLRPRRRRPTARGARRPAARQGPKSGRRRSPPTARGCCSSAAGRGRGGAELVDATDGRSSPRSCRPARRPGSSAGFLSGGRVAVATGRGGTLTLRLFDREGKPLRELPLGRGRWAWLGAPWSADAAAVHRQRRAAGEGAGWRGELRVVDLASGRCASSAAADTGRRCRPLVAGRRPRGPGRAGEPPVPHRRRRVVRVDDAGRQTPVLPRAGGSPAGR